MRSVDQPVSPAAGTTPEASPPLGGRQEVHNGESAQYVIKMARKAAKSVSVTLAVEQTNLREASVLHPQVADHLLQRVVGGGAIPSSSSTPESRWPL